MSGSAISSFHSRPPGAAPWLEVLALCEGFEVESSDGRVGVVSALHYAPSARWDSPSWLAVRAGRSADMLVIVPVAEIEGIFLTERRIVLRSSASIEASGRRGGHGRARASANGHAAARMMAEGLEHVVAGWCQGAVAEDAEGRAVRPWSAEARRWSLLGALLASWKGGPINDLGQALSALHTATDPSPLDLWNDRAERTQHDVVAAFERAIESVRSDKGTTFPNDERFGSWLRACSAGVSSWFR